MESLFDLVITRVEFRQPDNEPDTDTKQGRYLLKQPEFVVDFKIGDIKPNKHLNVADNVEFKSDLGKFVSDFVYFAISARFFLT